MQKQVKSIIKYECKFDSASFYLWYLLLLLYYLSSMFHIQYKRLLSLGEDLSIKLRLIISFKEPEI